MIMKLEVYTDVAQHTVRLPVLAREIADAFRHRNQWDSQKATELVQELERHALALYEHVSLREGLQRAEPEAAEERE